MELRMRQLRRCTQRENRTAIAVEHCHQRRRGRFSALVLDQRIA